MIACTLSFSLKWHAPDTEAINLPTWNYAIQRVVGIAKLLLFNTHYFTDFWVCDTALNFRMYQ